MAKPTNSTSSIVVVPFRTDQLITIQREDGIYVAIRPICERCGIDWSSQLQRIKRHPILAEAVVMTTTPFTRHGQEEACLRLDYLNGWLMGIDSKRVKEEVRADVIAYQRECYQVLFEHFYRKTVGSGARPRRGLTEEERAVRADLATRRQRVNEIRAATRTLQEIRLTQGVKAAAAAAPELFAPFGINLEVVEPPQGELPIDDNGRVH